MAKKLSIFMIVLMVFSLFQTTGLTTNPVSAAEDDFDVQLEDLDRGLVATNTSNGVFLSWRLLADEVTAYSDYGLRGTDFNVYRDGELIATVETSTNYLDPEGDSSSEYYVSAVVDGEEIGDISETVTPWSDTYYDLSLQKPEDGVTPAGEEYTYYAEDMSVGDVNGDGQYEYIVKWYPSNAKDVSQNGYTGNTYIDTYTFDGELLYRIDLGVNIRSGAHYTQFMVYDFDGNGKAELMMKTAPGTKIIRYDENGDVESEEYITMPQEDIDAGYSNEDDYRMSPDDYYEHVVDMFMGWHEHPEVVAGNWPATLEEAFGIERKYDYPLVKEDAESLVDYFMDEYAPTGSDLRNLEGYILTGPEYLTVFNGETGAEMDTVDYKPVRHDDGLMWGDYASAIEPGNRVDRFLAGVAYLDGEHPSAIFARGYYTRSTLVAYDFNGTSIEEKWFVDSGWTPMENPFDANPHGILGESEEYGTLAGQGNHQLSTADVDGDGKQEVIYGAATIDHDGSLLYSSFGILPEGSSNPGEEVRLGHGDSLHVADIDPDRPGLEIYSVFENAKSAPYGYALRDAETGEVIYGGYTGEDTGAGMIGDIYRGQRGLETWATDIRTADGEFLSAEKPRLDFTIKWAADMTTQIVNGRGSTPEIYDWENGVLLSAEGTIGNNGVPGLAADVLGDWREELLVRTEDSSAIRIYVNSEVTDRKLHTLMHDIQYRTGIAWQNTTYNQPAYPSFYFGIDMDWSNINIANSPELPYVEEEGPAIDTTELETLIDSATAISNDDEKYTEVSYQKLQDAIAEAETALETIQFAHELYAPLYSLQQAIDGLIEIVDLGPGYYFDFGTESSPLANGYERVVDTTEYTEGTGYGFEGGTDGSGDDGAPDDLRGDFILANESEFMVDLPDGNYDVRIITGSHLEPNATTYTLEEGESQGGIGTAKGEFVEYTDTVTVSDGQLNIGFSGERAQINALEIVAVEDFSVKYDFGTEDSPVRYSWEQVANTMVYDSERGYGLSEALAARDRGVFDDMRRDFVIGGDYEFMVDLRNGTYDIKVIAGDGHPTAANSTNLKAEGEAIGTVSSGEGELAELEGTVTVTDGQLNIHADERINGIEIYAAAIDVEEDVTAPSTSHEVEGEAQNGWYRDTVTLNFTAIDDKSGVDATYFSINNGEVKSGTSVEVMTEGQYIIHYWSEDEAGNVESKQEIGINIDRTAPVIKFSVDDGTEFGIDEIVTISCSAEDALSGVDSNSCKEYQEEAFKLGVGDHTFEAESIDKAGNQSSESITISVKVDYNNLARLTEHFFSENGNTKEPVAYTTKIEGAKKAAERGNLKARDGKLQAFINHVEAKADKDFQNDQAEYLITLTKQLMK